MPFCYFRLKAEKPPSTAYPKVLKTWGHHLRKRRLDLGLFQKEVAQRLGIHPMTVVNWELGRTRPPRRYRSGIIAFLGYEPPDPGETFGGD